MDTLFTDLRLDICACLSVKDVGHFAAVALPWRRDVDADAVWLRAYELSQHAEEAGAPLREGQLEALIKRPFGHDAVGWQLAVYMEDGSDGYRRGCVESYHAEADAYLISYDPPELQEGEELLRRRRVVVVTWPSNEHHRRYDAGQWQSQIDEVEADENREVVEEGPPQRYRRGGRGGGGRQRRS